MGSMSSAARLQLTLPMMCRSETKTTKLMLMTITIICGAVKLRVGTVAMLLLAPAHKLS